MKDVIIVIPIYKPFSETERCAFNRCREVLGAYPTTLLQPESFDSSPILAENEGVTATRFPDDYFTSVSAYNELMLSPNFYARFAEYRYLLIYQLDAYVFRDELMAWVSRGYDYIGAPWMPNSNLFQDTFGRVLRALKRNAPRQKGDLHVSHAQMHYHVGNGGFSLRRVEKMRQVLSDYQDLIATLPKGAKCRQEDVFLSVFIQREAGIRIPDWKEGLRFAFENNPTQSFRLTRGTLPFGCHYWPAEREWTTFWCKHINLKTNNK